MIILLDFTFIMLLTNLTLPELFKIISKPFVGGYKAVSEERIERAMQPPKEKTEKKQSRKSDKRVRIDIAKYYQEEDNTQDAGIFPYAQDAGKQENNDTPDIKLPFDPVRMPKSEDNSSGSDKKAEEQELKRIIEKAVAKEQEKIEEKLEKENPVSYTHLRAHET